jgi:hypothetical protein
VEGWLENCARKAAANAGELMLWTCCRWLGAGKIYLYDIRSKPPMSSSILEYIQTGFMGTSTFQAST